MTDQDLNKRLAEALGFEVFVFENYLKNGKVEPFYHVREGAAHWRMPDYCNDWNALMPLVVEYCVIERFEQIPGHKVWHMNNVHGTDLQRALVECLLKVLENK